MLNKVKTSNEEALFRCINTNGIEFEEYLSKVSNISDINYTDKSMNCSYLQCALRNKREDIARDLLKRGIDVNIQDKRKNTAASYAASRKNWKMLKLILEHNLDVNIKQQLDNTILWDVIFDSDRSSEYYEVLEALLSMGANPNSENIRGNTPLSLAKTMEDQILINMLENSQDEKETNNQLSKEIESKHVMSDKNGTYIIDMKTYKKAILIKGVSQEYLKEKIISYGEISGGKMHTHNIGITPMKTSSGYIISCPPEMNFYNYHNIMSWLWGTRDDKEKPEQNICVALHPQDACSYYAIVENTTIGDTLIGCFQGGEQFSIYLPEAYIEGGNATECHNELSKKNIAEYLEGCGFDSGWLNNEDKLLYSYLAVEIAVE